MNESTIGVRVHLAARSWLGTPYVHQASLKGVGCDCLGLVRGVWREVIGDEPEALPAYSSTWAEVATDEPLLNAARRNFVERAESAFCEGDLLIFRMRRTGVAKHVGIASGAKTFIHAYQGNAVVETFADAFWSSRIVGIFAFPNSSTGGV